MDEPAMDMPVEERVERAPGGGPEVGVEGAVGVAGEELAAVRAALLRAYPATVPEMVGGESVAALLASVEPAAEAYRRVAAAVGSREPGERATVGPYVPAGNVAPVAVDVAALPATEKIRRGLAARR